MTVARVARCAKWRPNPKAKKSMCAVRVTMCADWNSHPIPDTVLVVLIECCDCTGYLKSRVHTLKAKVENSYSDVWRSKPVLILTLMCRRLVVLEELNAVQKSELVILVNCEDAAVGGSHRGSNR